MIKIYLSLLLLALAFTPTLYGQGTVLLFVSHENTYYSEYIVMKAALEDAGYTVEVRSASTLAASAYMDGTGPDIAAAANTLVESSYTAFQAQYQALFGQAWDESLNTTPSTIPVAGRIQDVTDMSGYVALVVAGGTGVIDYRLDGTYGAQGSGPRLVSANEVQAAAEKLNTLAQEALQQGKPILGQCHGASLPAYWRVPATSGPGEESLGFSLLKDQPATGYPDAGTGTYTTALGIQLRTNDKVVIASPNSAYYLQGQTQYRIITSQDWFPQTVAYAARTLLNLLETHPSVAQREAETKVLILHGGALNESNCAASNRTNDVPCNYSGTQNLPADYTHLKTLLEATLATDNYDLLVADLNLNGTLPYDGNNETAIVNYLLGYDVVVFFKHWSDNVTVPLQNALVEYANRGGGVVGLHHGLYNDVTAQHNKNILVSDLFGVQSGMSGWSANLTNYNLYHTNLGHFVSTYGLSIPAAQNTPAAWGTNPLPAAASVSYAQLPAMAVYDELYNNMAFEAGQTFGRGLGQITPLFSNDQTPAGQCHTSGFVRRFNPSDDNTEGRVAYFITGERRETLNTSHAMGQVIRNAVVWAGYNKVSATQQPNGRDRGLTTGMQASLYPNPTTGTLWIQQVATGTPWQLYAPDGRQVAAGTTDGQPVQLQHISTGVYVWKAKGYLSQRLILTH